MHRLDLLVIGIYLFCILALGFFRNKNYKNESDEYILAGRKLSLPSLKYFTQAGGPLNKELTK